MTTQNKYNECDSDSTNDEYTDDAFSCSLCKHTVTEVKINTWRYCCITCSDLLNTRENIRILITRLQNSISDLKKEDLNAEYELFRRMHDN